MRHFEPMVATCTRTILDLVLHRISIPRSTYLFELSAVLDGDGVAGLATVGALGLDLLDNILSLEDLAEDDVTAIEPGGLDSGDEDCCHFKERTFKSKNGRMSMNECLE